MRDSRGHDFRVPAPQRFVPPSLSHLSNSDPGWNGWRYIPNVLYKAEQRAGTRLAFSTIGPIPAD